MRALALAVLPLQVLALEAVTFATDWKAQAEQGGFYQAKALGLYEKAGLDVTIRGGGPGVNIPQLLGASAIDFGMGSNSFIPLNMVRAGVPAKAVMAAFQKDPQVLITHPRADITTLADIKGKPVMIADASINAFWVWLRAKYDFSDRQIRKYTFNLAPFLVNPKAVQQGYVTSEPYTISTRGGFEPQVFLLSDFGYPSYAAMVLAQNRLIEDRPELVQAFVNASIEGWRSYIYGDPSPGNKLILAANPDMRQDIIDQAIEQIRQRGMLASPDTEKHGLGAMSEARWQSFFKTMSENGVYPLTLDWQNAFTTDFTNAGAP
ncbi:MAG: ABC transporter substrate-binding protein [Parvibaculales bacterium]